MKSILLASVASVAFAGIAAAEVTATGSFTLGYNDTDNMVVSNDPEQGNLSDDDVGFYADGDLSISLSQELDNGLTAGVSFGIDFADLTGGHALESKSYVLSLTSDMGGLYFGDTAFAAQTYWSAVGDMAADGFSEHDGEDTLRGEVKYGNVTAGVSYMVDTDGSFEGDLSDGVDGADVTYVGTGDLVQLSVGAKATFGTVNVSLAYQEAIAPGYTLPQTQKDGSIKAVFNGNGDISNDEVFGLSASTTFSGADVALGFAQNTTSGEQSIGASVGYTVGPVALAASYVDNKIAGARWNVSATYTSGAMAVTASTDEGSDWALEGSYDVGNGVMVYAGAADAGKDYYVAGTYDLGGGASLLVSYADDSDADNGDDEVGANDYQVGLTTEVSFSF